MSYSKSFAEAFELLWNKVCAVVSETNLLASPYSEKLFLHVFIKLSALKPSTFLIEMEFVVLNYNTKIILKDSCDLWNST